jgi:hypothetical protein
MGKAAPAKSSKPTKGGDDTEDKGGVALPKLDLRTKSSFNRAKAATRKEMKRLSVVSKYINSKNPLTNGVGAWGGPIAREVQSPGQHNGIHYKHKNLSSPQLHLTTEQMNEIMKEHTSIYLPQWDHNFTVAGVISKDVERIDYSRDKVYKAEMKKFRDVDAARDLARGVYESAGVDPAYYSSDYNKNDNNNILRSNNSSAATSPDGSERWRESQVKYMKTVRALHSAAGDISYKDLTDVACLREPPVFAEALVAYIGTLLGLAPNWAAAKRSLFHDCFSLMVFLEQVEPLTVPIKRLRTAVKLKRDKMRYLTVASCRGVNASRAFSLLANWVLSFNGIAKMVRALFYSSSFLSVMSLSLSLSHSSIAPCPPALSDAARHESNHHPPPPSLNHQSIDTTLTLLTIMTLHYRCWKYTDDSRHSMCPRRPCWGCRQ